MSIAPPNHSSDAELVQLLRRNDIWRGRSHDFTSSAVLDSGHDTLNGVLQGGGWPIGGLIEIYQAGFIQSEWLLLTPALMNNSNGLLVLLNPPHPPFAQALIQAGVDLDRIVVVESKSKGDFLSSFIELTRTKTCAAVLAWQPKYKLSYSDLRKCLLSSKGGLGIYVLFRPSSVQAQSSPATLRLSVCLQKQGLLLKVLKQRGELGVPASPVLLPLPEAWQGLQPHGQLGQGSHLMGGRLGALQGEQTGRQ